MNQKLGILYFSLSLLFAHESGRAAEALSELSKSYQKLYSDTLELDHPPSAQERQELRVKAFDGYAKAKTEENHKTVKRYQAASKKIREGIAERSESIQKKIKEAANSKGPQKALPAPVVYEDVIGDKKDGASPSVSSAQPERSPTSVVRTSTQGSTGDSAGAEEVHFGSSETPQTPQ